MRIAALILIVTFLAGCGQKGPLTLPDKTTGGVVTRPTQTPAETPPADEAQKKKDETDKKP